MNSFYVIACFFISLSVSVNSQIVQKCIKCREFYSCGGACQNTCLTLGEECKIINIKCNDWCYCEPGYARNEKNVCIPEWKCPNHLRECLRPNEEFLSNGACQNTCAHLNQHCLSVQNEGCYCKPGFARDAFYTCIPVKECIVPPVPCKDLNEVYTCRTCDTNCTTIGQCKDSVKPGCQRECHCRAGYVRGPNGYCIQESNCYGNCLN